MFLRLSPARVWHLSLFSIFPVSFPWQRLQMYLSFLSRYHAASIHCVVHNSVSIARLWIIKSHPCFDEGAYSGIWVLSNIILHTTLWSFLVSFCSRFLSLNNSISHSFLPLTFSNLSHLYPYSPVVSMWHQLNCQLIHYVCLSVVMYVCWLSACLSVVLINLSLFIVSPLQYC